MKVDAVFQGGGVKGIGFVGAICRMEQEGLEWDRLAGTSAGAIVASLLAVGYDCMELKEIMSELDYSKLLNRDKLQAIPLVGRSLGIVFRKGCFRTDGIEAWLADLYGAKKKTKFGDLDVRGGARLKIIAADVTKRKMIVFPDSLVNYGLDPMKFEIAKAVAMSISIPVFFVPQVLEYRNKKSYVVDGGIFSNFPVWIFEGDRQHKPIIGFKFDNDRENHKFRRNSLSYFQDLFESIIEAVDEEYVSSSSCIRTVTIRSDDVSTLNFHIAPSLQQILYQRGYSAADKLIATKGFQRFLEQCSNPERA